MATSLTIAVARPRRVASGIAANPAIHADVIRTTGARVVVFLGLSLTSFRLDAQPVAETNRRLNTIVRACAQTGTEALVGAPVQGESGREYIAMLAIDADGIAVAYCKVNLSPGTSHSVPGRYCGRSRARPVGVRPRGVPGSCQGSPRPSRPASAP